MNPTEVKYDSNFTRPMKLGIKHKHP